MSSGGLQGLHGKVLSALGPAIVGGEIPAGTVLRAEELAERYGVSRTVVREAVRVLESMRLVGIRRRVGITVAPPEEWDVFAPEVIAWRLEGADRPRQLRSLTMLRSAVEPMAAELAAQNATAEQAGRLTALAIEAAATAKAGDLRTFLGHDIEFHRLLLCASGNEMFAQLGDVVAAVLTGRTEHHLMPAHPAPEAVRWHIEVAEAVRCGEPSAARRAMSSIVVRAMEELSELG
jgi:DNA-binding FadR family transcriptional regulator